MKKKLVVASLVVALLAIAVGGTLAWFTAEDSATNTFTIGSVEIEQNETNEDGSAFTQSQVLLPIVNVTSPSEDVNYVDKIVNVKSTGENATYVRTFIAVPTAIKDILVLDTVDVETADAKWEKDSNTWDDVEVDGISYSVISFTYTEALEKEETTAEPVLKGVYLKETVDVQDNNGTKQFCTLNEDGETYTFYACDITSPVKVLVATQGCQAEGFENGAANAIDTAFGGKAPDFTKVQE
ncbi:MAG: hypothetical protein IJZ53_03330 [Tyzzerella sp.]|nr:hypothetical protein [Tyzzerella sp.]